MFFSSRETPYRKIPWYINPVPCNPVKSQSRPTFPVQSRDGSIPSCTVLCFKCPFLFRPGEFRDISIPRDPVTTRKFGPEESPGLFYARGSPCPQNNMDVKERSRLQHDENVAPYGYYPRRNTSTRGSNEGLGPSMFTTRKLFGVYTAMEGRASTGALAGLTMRPRGAVPRKQQPMQASDTGEGKKKRHNFHRAASIEGGQQHGRGGGTDGAFTSPARESIATPRWPPKCSVSPTAAAAMSIGSHTGVGGCVSVASHQSELSHSGGGVGQDRCRGKGLSLRSIRAWRRAQRKGNTAGDEP